MEAGKLRNQITLQSPTRTESPTSGEVKITWSDVRIVWASLRPLSARELTAYAQTQLRTTHEVRVRYDADITGSMRFLFCGRKLNIVGPPLDPDGRRRELKILVEEKA